MKNIKFDSVKINPGFWQKRQDINKDVTVYSIYDRFDDTGRFRALKCEWKEGDTPSDRPHIFWDSDVAKWIESVAYIVKVSPDAKLEELADAAIENLEKNQWEDGYINTYYTTIEPENRFKNRDHHELYCAGHLIEAAVAYYEATGKRKLLDCMEKYAALIEKLFLKENSAGFVTPGHEEIELALIKLYEATGEERWKTLAEYFIDNRGYNQKNESGNPCYPSYSQSHLPVREQTTAEGHAVRAVYLYCAMADLARLNSDEALLKACDTLFDNIINKRMYITGGIGSTAKCEAFTQDYDLPNITAYTESCAAIGLALFARRLQLLHESSVYADIIEKVMYNGFLSSTTLDGKAFFYENPLEIPAPETKLGDVRYPITQRLEVFGCSCCPPNISRFMATVADGMYTQNEEKNIIYVQQFIASETELTVNGQSAKITQTTKYPYDGNVKISYEGPATTIAVRVPAWCDSYKGETKNGYAFFEVEGRSTLEFNFVMRPVFMEANEGVNDDLGRCALLYGPIVLCLEGVDNGKYLKGLRIKSDSEPTYGYCKELDLPTLKLAATRRVPSSELYVPLKKNREECTAEFIPYFAFANRGESEMIVWVHVD